MKKITIITNKKIVINAIENQIIKNEMIYDCKLFDTLDDFIEHLYQLAIILSNTNTSITWHEIYWDITIDTTDGGKWRHKKTFIYNPHI